MRKYRPSNGTEGMDFMARWCQPCVRAIGCRIIEDTMVYGVTDTQYPKEWTYGPNGQPMCTAFKRMMTAEEKAAKAREELEAAWQQRLF